MNRPFILLLILILVATFGASAAHAQGVPPVFQLFYGTVEINGQPAPVGTTIEARGAGVLTPNDNPNVKDNPLTLTFAGQYGVNPGQDPLDPKLMVQGSIADGTPVEFYVNGEKAECAIPDGAWQSSFPFTSGGVITRLSLRVGAAVQPTATPTTGAVNAATATPRPQTGVTDPTPTPGPGPTATRLLTGPTNTPVQAAAPTAQVAAPAATARPGSPATALPGSIVATPTGLAPQATGQAASLTPEPASLAAATAAPTEAQAAVVATPLPTRTPASVAQVVTSEPILKDGTTQAPVDAAPTNAGAGSGRSVVLWGGLGALLIAIAVGVLIKVRH